mmetsp:Transcript_17192/g.24846  ORF Transcript_17192/g.24846 Transcript_17192/m.24846 type:complete len:81 (-) Transcript_17192:49-291(-)
MHSQVFKMVFRRVLTGLLKTTKKSESNTVCTFRWDNHHFDLLDYMHPRGTCMFVNLEGILMFLALRPSRIGGIAIRLLRN